MKAWILLLLTSAALCQTPFHTPENRRLFADHLFCTGDYLRAADEYREYLKSDSNDTVRFKISLSLSGTGQYEEANSILSSLSNSPAFRESAGAEMMKNLLLLQRFEELKEYDIIPAVNGQNTAKKLRNISYLYGSKDSLPSPPYLLIPYKEEERTEIMKLYDLKSSLPEKDPVLAAFMSFMFPGLGKVYTEEYGDAVFAALATGIFGYLAYTNFRNDHTFRGVLFTGIAGWFYGGNVYGAAASAVLFNAKVNFSFTSLVDEYLLRKNWFISDYGFCR